MTQHVHVVPPAVQLTLKECLSQIGLAYSASQLINCQLQFTGFGYCGRHMTFFTYTHTLTPLCKCSILFCLSVLRDLHLCQQDPLDFLRCPMEQCRWCRSSPLTWTRGLSAHHPHGESPLCVFACVCVCAYVFERRTEKQITKFCFVTINIQPKLR